MCGKISFFFFFLITFRRLKRTPEASTGMKALNVLAVWECVLVGKKANVSRLEGNAKAVGVCLCIEQGEQ